MTTKPCPHCGRNLNQIIILGRPTRGFHPCNCPGSVKLELDLKAAREAKEQRRRVEALKRYTCQLYGASGLSDLFTALKLADLQRDAHNDAAISAAKALVAGERRGLWLYGPTARGKTQIAQSACAEIIAQCVTVAYVSAVRMIDDTRAMSDMGPVASERRQEKERFAMIADVLMIDDLGKEKLTEAFEAQLFKFVDEVAKNEKRRLIVTTNLRPAEILDRYDPAVYSRILSRCGNPIECGGQPFINGKRREGKK